MAALAIRSTPAQNVLLMIASLLFYAYGEPAYVLLMVIISVLTYVFGRAIGSAEQPSARKLFAAIAILVALGCLGVFKYTEWFTGILGSLIDESLAVVGIALPVGISFYTFQAISYIIDVYRKEVEPQRNLLHVVLYISFFPQLIAGPIIRYHDVEKQLSHRRITWEGVHIGLRRFIVGLAKKVLIADVLAVAVDAIYGANVADVTAPAAWIAAFAYLLQIYFDFSAYSDMAIGMARMFGFTYQENFNYPFTSTSIKVFWRKWHISLSTWFKEYLYFPLGGNRKGRPRTVFNKIVIFFCCGLWHGAAWTFVIWGLIHGFFLLLEEYLPIHKLPKPIGWLYAMMVVMLAFVLFRAETFDQAAYFIMQMFTGWGAMSASANVLLSAQLTPLFLFSLVLGCIGSFPWLPKLKDKVAQQSIAIQKRVDLLSNIACLVLLVLCMLTLAGGAYSPFIYFRF